MSFHRYYEGVVKSFDTEKNKHVVWCILECLISFAFFLQDSWLVIWTSKVLYDDGDVEVLRLDRERWDLVKSGLKAKVNQPFILLYEHVMFDPVNQNLCLMIQ